MKKTLLTAGLHLVCLASSSHALSINLNAPVGMDPNALSGFQMAAAYWQSKLTDNVTVNFNVNFSALPPNVLGSTSSSSKVYYVGNIMSALAFDATTANDALAVGHLPALNSLGTLDFLTQRNTEGGSAVISLDNDPYDPVLEADANPANDLWNNNAYFAITTANAKALGETFASNWVDASIEFSSLFSWDFDNSDGVGTGLQDFVGVTIHEMGHALGFESGVDLVDFYISNPADLDPYAVYNTLDLYRYGAPGTLNLGAGANAYFSLDGGVTSLGQFSTGTLHGDGRQASHWKDNLGLGIMDPTANPAGQVNTPTVLDLTAFDVIGWDLVPEPSTLLLGCVGVLAALGRRRH